MESHARPGLSTRIAWERSWVLLSWVGIVAIGIGWWYGVADHTGPVVALLLAGGGGSRDPDPDLFESHPDPVVRFREVDGARVVDAMNPSFDEVLEHDPVELRGVEVSELLEQVAEVDNGTPVEALLDPEVNPNVLVAESYDGQRDFLVRTTGRSDAGYLILTDITQERDRARDLVAQKNRLEEFASIVSHDLRNPLDVAKVRLEAAQETGEPIHFEKVEGAHDRMERIIADVLDLARQGRVIDDVEDVDFEDVVEDAWSTVDTGPAAIELEETGPAMQADPERLQELLENLFRNAIEHGGEEVTVSVGLTDGGFYVADDGSGIPDEKRAEIFEPGFTSSDTGTGFGLAIVRRIAEAHGWAIEAVESANGARFEVSGVTWT